MDDFCGLKLEYSPSVYEPSDDSELMVNAIRDEAFGRVLDLGCGTGVIGIAASLCPKVSSVVCADINPDALALASKNAALNFAQKKMSFVQSDLFGSLANEKFDTISFNPPYLPTAQDEKVAGPLNRAFDGGADGRAVTSAFLSEFSGHLSKGGVLVLLQSSLSGTQESRELLESLGFGVQVHSSRKFFFEEISALVCRRE